MQEEPATDAAPAASARIVVERPAPGLARGRWEWPAWGIGLLGGAIVAAALAWWILRLIGVRRGIRGP
jgi:hypothetical protein